MYCDEIYESNSRIGDLAFFFLAISVLLGLVTGAHSFVLLTVLFLIIQFASLIFMISLKKEYDEDVFKERKKFTQLQGGNKNNGNTK